MAKAKSDQFPIPARELAAIAKALGHPARIQILKILAAMDICMCGDIVEQLPLSQATVSQHLKELKRVGLIHGNIEGPKTCYCIDKQRMAAVRELFGELFSDVCCGKVC